MNGRAKDALRAQLSREYGPGTSNKEGLVRFALVYPSPYQVAMSSLGYLQIYRLLNARPGTSCERAMLPEHDTTPLFTLETQRSVSEFDVVGISHAYELEGAGLVTCLVRAGLEPLAENRSARDPLVVLGGPITFSNPLPYAPFADLVILGEAEEAIDALLVRLEESPAAARGDALQRKKLLEDIASLPGFYVPSLHGDVLPPIARAPDDALPAHSQIFTRDTELHDMQLIEPERGCHRGCTFCVMRRSTNGGMRLVSPDRLLALTEVSAPRVGLVGAAVTDHPQIKEILRRLIDDHGKKVGISSLRADRLDEEFVGLLARGGYRSMTVALDAPSVRQRDQIEKNLKTTHVLEAARLARAHEMRHLKVYVIIGLPDERPEDLDELADFALELARFLPVVLAVSPFVPKFHTPLADAPFLGEERIALSLEHLKDRLGRGGRVKLRGPGVREAYVEYRLAQGGLEHAQAVVKAEQSGGGLRHWIRALDGLPERVRPKNFDLLVPAPTPRRRYRGTPLPVLNTEACET